MPGAGLIQPDAGGSSCALSEGTGREVGMHPDYSPVFGSPLGLDSPTLRKCVAQEQRRQWSDHCKHTHAHTHAEGDANAMRRSGVKKWQKMCVSLTSLSSPHFFFHFFFPLQPARNRSSLRWRHAAPLLCSREQQQQQQACRGRPGRRERRRRKGGREERRRDNAWTDAKKKKTWIIKIKTHPSLLVITVPESRLWVWRWMTDRRRQDEHCKAVETILLWLCESGDIKRKRHTCAVKSSAILHPTIVLQNVSQPVKTGFRCQVIDLQLVLFSKFTTVPESSLWRWRWMTDSRRRVMTR